MQTEPSPRGSLLPRRRPAALAGLTVAAVAAVSVGVLLTGCGSGSGDAAEPDAGTSPSSSSPEREDARILWLGDSIAGVEGAALEAALTASGVEFLDASSDGGGTVVEGDEMSRQIAESTWSDLTEHIASFRPTVIAYQITTYDWGTPQRQRASYERLAETAGDADADLVIVSAPPFRIDDFYRPHESAIDSAPEMAEEVAESDGDQVHFLDAAALWGTESGAEQAQRAPDGIHSCQQGSAAFAAWFGEELGARYGFAPAAPEEWATGAWTGDERFAQLGCA
ncbi:SGNH/GDSL hydrolase family protein [Streptomyces sp. B6B3]|uniref:SGNH/GDSL hydrolase family protein n=1 Tax=Streptomyces sp. B6B3 TaxID=3153570 RepID=UPI00325F2252